MFETGTKKNPDPVVGLDTLRAAKAIATDLPIVAIGGIRRSTLLDVLSAGAESAAIISEILMMPENIRENLQDLIKEAHSQRR